MLTLDGLEIGYDGFRLRADMDMDVRPGRIVAVIGPSGGGKSTLLSAIAGFSRPLSGRVLWNGADITPMSPGDRPLSILFQDNNLFPHLSAEQNAGLGLRPDLRLSAAQKDRVAEMLDRVGLSGFETRKPAQLSGGQGARVSLARALLRARPILLLDEPFAALGPALKSEMLTLARDAVRQAGTTTLMVSHEPKDAQRIAAQTIVVANGRATPPVATGALFEDPPEALRDYLGT